MHIVEAFASSCGLKINKPYIFEKYHPLNFEKYIIIETNDAQQAKNYDYWQEVVNLIYPSIREQNIAILQMCGQNDQRLINTYTISGYSLSQKAYLIKNSMIYLGANLYSIQVASFYDKKIIALYGNIYSNLNRPYWSNEINVKLFQPFNDKLKPSFLPQENPKNINKIKPDEIASSILSFLNLKNNIKHKFLEIGNSYNNRTIEVVPNMVVNPQSLNVPHVIVRMDINFNEEILKAQLSQGKCLIITNKTISENIIKTFKNNIIQIIYEIDHNNDPNFIKIIKSLNINYVMISYLEEEEINKYKIDYLDFELIIKIPKIKKVDNKEIKFYKSNHFILSRNKLYMSEAAEAKDLPIKDFNENTQEIIDSDIFWKYKENYALLS